MKKNLIGFIVLWSIIVVQIAATTSSVIVSYASNQNVIDPYEKIPYVDDATSLGLQVIDSLPEATLAFEVPLYITVAVADLEEEVIAPNNYGITNLSQDSYNEGVNMAVIWVEATPRTSKTYWKFVDTLTDQDDEMTLSIGGVPIVIEGDESVYLDLNNSVFYNKEEKMYIPIAYQERVQLDIIGKVNSSLRVDDASSTAVAQFSIKYIVSQLDESGEPVGVYYEGPYPAGYTP